MPKKSNPRPMRIRTFLKWLPTTLPLVGLLYFLWEMHALRRDYPNLVDNSPGVDSYWPGVGHIFAAVLAVVCLLIALLVASITLARSRSVGSSHENVKGLIAETDDAHSLEAAYPVMQADVGFASTAENPNR